MYVTYTVFARKCISTAEEDNTDESSAIEAEQNNDDATAGKDEQPMDQSDGVGDSSAPAAQAPDSSKFWLIY